MCVYFVSIFQVVLYLLNSERTEQKGKVPRIPLELPITEEEFHELARTTIQKWRKLKLTKKYRKIPVTEVFLLFRILVPTDINSLQSLILTEVELNEYFRSIEGKHRLH